MVDISYERYITLRQNAAMDPEDDIPQEMWEDTPDYLRVADIEELEKEAEKFRIEQISIAPTSPGTDKPDTEITPW